METRNIGRLQVSVVGLGTNNFGMRIDEKAAEAVVRASLDEGINHFDTADIYGGGKSEEFLGRALKGRRDEAVIATKFGAMTGAKADVVRKSVDESLARLGTDRIDILYIHRPDPETPIAETLAALDDATATGKVREIACSNFDRKLLDEAGWRFSAVQNQLNLLNRRDEPLLPALANHRTAYVPYFPLASGMLTGKYTRGEAPPEGTRMATMPDDRRNATLNDRNFELVDRLTSWAADHGHSVLELAIAWLLAKQPVASVIAGATKPEQVKANAAAARWQLTPDEVAEVESLV
jgi:aryl-alcohol dehydrogenase-like predicted oxidoreductase